MSSIASARRGQKKRHKGSDFVRVTGDFERVINQWRHTERGDWQVDDEFRVEIICLVGSENGTHGGNNDFVRLNQFLVLDTNIRRGSASLDVYKMTLSEATRGEIVIMRNIVISADAEEPVDVLKCPDASCEQVGATRSRRK